MESDENHKQNNQTTRINVVNPEALKSQQDGLDQDKEGNAEKNDPEDRQKPPASLLRKIFGTIVYVYFAVFVIFHVVAVLIFLMAQMDNPWSGLFVWLLLTVAGGVCVVILSLWRDSLYTLWD